MTKFQTGPPGWLAQWLVTLSVLLFVFLAGFDIAAFYPLFVEAGTVIVALIPVSLAPWLSYKTIKALKARNDDTSYGGSYQDPYGVEREGEDEEVRSRYTF